MKTIDKLGLFLSAACFGTAGSFLACFLGIDRLLSLGIGLVVLIVFYLIFNKILEEL